MPRDILKNFLRNVAMAGSILGIHFLCAQNEYTIF